MPKMKLWKRAVLMTQAGLGAAGTLLFALGAFGLSPLAGLNHWVTGAGSGLRPGALIALILLIAALAALCALSFTIAFFAGRTRGARLLTLRDEGGDEILLTRETLDQLARMAVGEPEGVSDIRVFTAYADHMAAVTVEIGVSSAINIPETTRAIQSRVRERLEGVSGIPVSSADIRVTSLRVETTAPATSPDADGENESAQNTPE